MSDSRNKIQKYISAYQTTLRDLGATNVVTKIMGDINENVDSTDFNPSKTGKYWDNDLYYGNEEVFVNGIDENGFWMDGIAYYNDESSVGVRPWIKITI